MIRYTERFRTTAPTTLVDAGYEPLLARLLAARGVESPAQAEAFLYPSLDMLADPFALSGMATAVELIREAVGSGKRILIYGDYDVDGVCACSIIHEALERHGANVSHYVPSRHDEGYGLTVRALEKLRPDCDIIITVDCGITSVMEAHWALEHQLTLIITDHHEPPEQLPVCDAIIDPLIDNPKAISPCGAGVAFKLVQALYGLSEAERSLDLAALATIADLVPLLGENRIIAAVGLDAIRISARPGLCALIDVVKLNQKSLSAGQVGYQIAPRINAGGRIAHANRNIELMLTQNTDRAAELASELNRENERRQQMQGEVFAEADKCVLAETDFLRERVLMPVGDGWNHGVIGLVASALVEKYRIPAIVFTREATEDGLVCVGSARSIPGVHIQRVMTACADLFIRFGGHAQAAGCTIMADKLPELRERLNTAIANQTDPSVFVPTERYDAEIALKDIDLPMIDRLKRLEPHGIGNPAPAFRIKDAHVLSAKACGSSLSHLKMLLGQDGCSIDAIAFGQANRIASMSGSIDVLAHGVVNEWQGRRSVQCQVACIALDSPAASFEARCGSMETLFEDALADALLLDSDAIEDAISMPRDRLFEQIAAWLRQSFEGTLIVCATKDSALDITRFIRSSGLDDRLDYIFGTPNDPRAFNTLAALPDLASLLVRFARIVIIDGVVSERGADKLRSVCQGAGIWRDEDANAKYEHAVLSIAPDDDQLRLLYKALRSPIVWRSVAELAAACGMQRAMTRVGLEIFSELGLLEMKREPFEAVLRPTNKRSLSDSLLYRHIKGIKMPGRVNARIAEPKMVSV